MTNRDLLQVAEEFGSPVYVYDAEKIIFQYNRLKRGRCYGAANQYR